jgi:hypothetical protein
MHKKYRFIILDNDINILVSMLLKDTVFDDTVWPLTSNKRKS